MEKKNLDERIANVNNKLRELKKRWPAHSLKPAMMEQLEELEDELAVLLQEKERGGS